MAKSLNKTSAKPTGFLALVKRVFTPTEEEMDRAVRIYLAK